MKEHEDDDRARGRNENSGEEYSLMGQGLESENSESTVIFNTGM